jgi:hypothetical protein
MVFFERVERHAWGLIFRERIVTGKTMKERGKERECGNISSAKCKQK